jgi:flagellar basal body rod protein FlgG
MLHGVYVSTAGAFVEQARIDVIANNLANANTNAYKTSTAIFRRRLEEASEDVHVGHRSDPVQDAIGGGVFLDEVSYSHATGPLQVSSDAFDVALDGDGFFAVSDGQQTLYTRDGRWRRSPDGFLTLAHQNVRLLDASGRPIAIPEGKFQVDERGAVTVDGLEFGSVGLWGSLDPGRFQRLGEGLYRYTGEPGGLEAAEPEVRQNFRELSDVNPVREMVRLVESQRAYEINMQMLKIQDGSLQQAVSQIARVTA